MGNVFAVSLANVIAPTLTTPTLLPSNPRIDAGQGVPFNVIWSGGTPSFAVTPYSTPAPPCNSGSTYIGWYAPGLDTYMRAFGPVYPTSNTYYCAQIMDSSSTPQSVISVNSEIIVSNALTTPILTPNSPTTTNGIPVTLTATWTGGTSTYTVNWYSGASASCASDTTLVTTYTGINTNSNSLRVTPSSSTYYCANVMDSAMVPMSVNSIADQVTIVTANALTAPTLLPSNPTIDSGQSITFSSSWSGGTSTFTANIFSSASSTCNSGSTLVQKVSGLATNTVTFNPVAPTSNTYYCVYVTDSSSTPQTTNSINSEIIVSNALTAPTLLPSNPKIDSGQSITFSSSWSGGTSTFTANIFSSASSTCNSGSTLVQKVSGLATNTVTFNPVAPPSNTYYCVYVTDSSSTPQTKNSINSEIIVSNALNTPTLLPSNPTIEKGQPLTFNSAWTGGSQPFTANIFSSASTTCNTGNTLVQKVSGLATNTVTFNAVAPTSNTYYCVYITDSSFTPQTRNSINSEITVSNSIYGATLISTIQVKFYPYGVAYNPVNGYMYVVDGGNNIVSVISGTTVVANVAVGSDPYFIAYDSGNGDMYVTNLLGSSVTVISGTNVIATVTVGADPYEVAYDSGNGDIYVADWASNIASVISGTTVVANVAVGSSPYDVAYNPSNGYVYVTNDGGSSVTAISGTSAVATIPVGVNPSYEAAYNPSNGYMYVPNNGGNTISVISGTSVVSNVIVGSSPYAVAYNPTNSYMYVTNSGSGTVSVISGTSVVATVAAGSSPEGVTYDPANGYMYVMNNGGGTVTVISGNSLVGTVSVGSGPREAAYNPSNGYMYVMNNAGSTVSIIG